MSWRERATKSGLFYSEPVTSGPRIDVTGCGSSEGWTTPRTVDANGIRTSRKALVSGRNSSKPSILQQCEGMVRNPNAWPTPTAEDSESTRARAGTTDTLTSKAREWPTPQKWDGERGAEIRETKQARGSGGVNLAQAAKDWPMPKQRDHKGKSQRGIHAPEDALPNMVAAHAGPPDPANSSTNGRSRDYVGPRSDQPSNGIKPRTPQASLAFAGTQSRGGDRKDELLLSGQVRAESPSPGSLNPRWVLQLMGFPADYLDGVEPPSKRSGTR